MANNGFAFSSSDKFLTTISFFLILLFKWLSQNKSMSHTAIPASVFVIKSGIYLLNFSIAKTRTQLFAITIQV